MSLVESGTKSGVKADLSSISLRDICKNVCARLRWLQSPKSRHSAVSGLCSERAQHDRPETRYTPWACHAPLQICPAVSSTTSEEKPSTSVLQFREKNFLSRVGFEPTTFGLQDRCSTTELWWFLKIEFDISLINEGLCWPLLTNIYTNICNEVIKSNYSTKFSSESQTRYLNTVFPQFITVLCCDIAKLQELTFSFDFHQNLIFF